MESLSLAEFPEAQELRRRKEEPKTTPLHALESGSIELSKDLSRDAVPVTQYDHTIQQR